ncbi:MAG: serine hydrolase domain-containing protein [Bacteroidia bacterium]
MLSASKLFSQEFTFTEAQQTLIDTNIVAFPEQTELAFAIIKNGEVFYYGIRKENGSYSSINNQQSVFEIGSISKVFTSMLMTQMHLENKLDMHQPVRKYLKVKWNEKRNFTFVHLANHSSGLPRLPHNILKLVEKYPLNPYAHYGEEELLYYLKHQVNYIDELGKASHYSNLGSGLMAYTLTKIEKKSFEELLQQRIFSKLSMSNSSTDRTKLQSLIVSGRNVKGDTVPNWDLNVLAGAGAILSNVEDMAKFALHAMKKNDVNQLMQTETIAINDKMSVGLGWHLYKNKEENRQVLWHNGGTGGYSSSMCVDVENNNAVIILSNVNPEALENQNLDIISLYFIKSLKPTKE